MRRKVQPNSHHCFVCGLQNPIGLKLRFYETGPGEVTAEYTVGDEYQGYPGIVHGGVVAALLDEVCGRVHMNGNPQRFYYTARLTMRYRKNVPVGEPLKIVGRTTKGKRRTPTSTGSIYGASGELLAEAEAILVEVPDELYESSDLEALGWKVYPD